MIQGELPDNNEEDEKLFDLPQPIQQLQRENSNKMNSFISPLSYLYPFASE